MTPWCEGSAKSRLSLCLEVAPKSTSSQSHDEDKSNVRLKRVERLWLRVLGFLGNMTHLNHHWPADKAEASLRDASRILYKLPTSEIKRTYPEARSSHFPVHGVDLELCSKTMHRGAALSAEQRVHMHCTSWQFQLFSHYLHDMSREGIEEDRQPWSRLKGAQRPNDRCLPFYSYNYMTLTFCCYLKSLCSTVCNINPPVQNVQS